MISYVFDRRRRKRNVRDFVCITELDLRSEHDFIFESYVEHGEQYLRHLKGWHNRKRTTDGLEPQSPDPFTEHWDVLVDSGGVKHYVRTRIGETTLSDLKNTGLLDETDESHSKLSADAAEVLMAFLSFVKRRKSISSKVGIVQSQPKRRISVRSPKRADSLTTEIDQGNPDENQTSDTD